MVDVCAGYLSSLVNSVENSIGALESPPVTSRHVLSVAHLVAQFTLLGKATSNTAHNIEFGDSKYTPIQYRF